MRETPDNMPHTGEVGATDHLPSSLHSLSADLDRLGEAERCSVPGDRLHTSTEAAVRDALVPAPIPIASGRRQSSSKHTALRFAAAIAVVGGAVGAAWYALSPTRPMTPTAIEPTMVAVSDVSDDVDLLLAALESDFGLADAGASLGLELDAQAIETELENRWVVPGDTDLDTLLGESI